MYSLVVYVPHMKNRDYKKVSAEIYTVFKQKNYLYRRHFNAVSNAPRHVRNHMIDCILKQHVPAIYNCGCNSSNMLGR